MSLHWSCLNRKLEYLFLNEHSLNNKIVIWPTTWWSASFYPSLISFPLICIFWVFCLLWICIHIDKTKSQSKCLLVYMYISCSLNLIREYYRLHVCIFLIVVLFLHGWEWLCDRVFCSAMLQIIVDKPTDRFQFKIRNWKNEDVRSMVSSPVVVWELDSLLMLLFCLSFCWVFFAFFFWGGGFGVGCLLIYTCNISILSTLGRKEIYVTMNIDVDKFYCNLNVVNQLKSTQLEAVISAFSFYKKWGTGHFRCRGGDFPE